MGQVFLRFESLFSVQVKQQLYRLCSALWNSSYFHFLETSITGIAATECLISRSFGKEVIKVLCSAVIRPIQQHNVNIYVAVLV